jgi:BASS family bile acid:Na+ symporter
VVEIIPLWLVNLLSFTTVFSVMASIGTAVAPATCLAHVRSPAALLRGLASVLVVVPAIGIAAGFALNLTLAEQVGITLMAIAPGAPLALRRALSSGGDAGFAPTLQVAVAIFAVPAVPCWVVIANAILGTHGIADVVAIARQVFLAQLLPLALGGAVKRMAPEWGGRIGAALARANVVLLVAAIVSQLVDLQYVILATRIWPVVAAATTTCAALLLGHLWGGRTAAVRHSVAIAGALRNFGLAFLVATTSHAPPDVEMVVVSYALTAFLVVTAYIVLYRRLDRH